MSLATDTQPAVVLLGDSITQFSNVPDGLGTKMNERFVRLLDVINRGYSGYNTEMILPMARKLLNPAASSSQEIKFMTLWLGANDAVLFSTGSRQTVSLDSYAQNLKSILLLLPPSTPKFLITPPLVMATRWKEHRGLEVEDRSEERTKEYAQVCRDVAGEIEGVVLVDVWKAMEDYRASGKDIYPLFTDGLHLSSAGYELVNSVLFPLIEACEVVQKLEQPYPDWQVALEGEK